MNSVRGGCRRTLFWHLVLFFSPFRGGCPSSFRCSAAVPFQVGALRSVLRETVLHSPPVFGPFVAMVLLAGDRVLAPSGQVGCFPSLSCFACPFDPSFMRPAGKTYFVVSHPTAKDRNLSLVTIEIGHCSPHLVFFPFQGLSFLYFARK